MTLWMLAIQNLEHIPKDERRVCIECGAKFTHWNSRVETCGPACRDIAFLRTAREKNRIQREKKRELSKLQFA